MTIRFMPDTWQEAVLRPVTMASPDAGVYVEFIAPDFRFVFALVLAIALVLVSRSTHRRWSVPVVLFVFVFLSFVPWLGSSGNGRYFIAVLLIIGPVCIGLLHRLPATKVFRLGIAIGMVLWQGFLLYEVDPWGSWGLVSWKKGPGFDVRVPPAESAQPASYVTLSGISYSLIAPRFHPESRWLNISALNNPKSRASLRAREFLDKPGPLKVIFPSLPGQREATTGIDPALSAAVNLMLSRQGLAIDGVAHCRLLPSTGLAGLAADKKISTQGGLATADGFWLCPLLRRSRSEAREAPNAPPHVSEVFAKIERTCPRLFPPGQTGSLSIPTGAVRGYPSSDFKLYVLDDGRVLYKYFRALNPVLVGSVDEVLRDGFVMDCERIRGRGGLPWDREI